MRRRTPRCPMIQPDRIVIGVDIAKTNNVAVAQFGDGTEAKPKTFKTNRQGFETLIRYAQRAVQHAKATGFVVAFEATGHYGQPLLAWLTDKDIPVMRVEPLHTSRFKEIYDGTRRKTDAKDAAIIATLCRQGTYRPWRILAPPFAELRALSKRRQQLTKQRAATKNRLQRHLDVVFPELRTLFSDITCKTACLMLSRAPLPQDLLACDIEMLGALLRKASRGRLGIERARKIQQAARDSIGAKHAPQSHRIAIQQAVAELMHLQPLIDEVERAMKAQLGHIDYARHLLSIPKIGTITVATLLGEFGDLRGYRHSAQLIKMAGLDLIESSSGKKRGQRRISRRGRSYARQILYLAALRLGGGALAEQRRRMVEENKLPPVKAAVANCCRLLRIMHALVRDGVDFKVPAAPAVRQAA